jgi:hypothetical protein
VVRNTQLCVSAVLQLLMLCGMSMFIAYSSDHIEHCLIAIGFELCCTASLIDDIAVMSSLLLLQAAALLVGDAHAITCSLYVRDLLERMQACDGA